MAAALFPLPLRRSSDRIPRNDTADTRASVLFQARFPEGPFMVDGRNRRAISAEVKGRFGSQQVLLALVISVLAEDKEYGIDSEAVTALFAASPALHAAALALVRLTEDMDGLDDAEVRGQLRCIGEGARMALALTVNPIRQVTE